MTTEQEVRGWYDNHLRDTKALSENEDAIQQRASAIDQARALYEAGELRCGDSIEHDFRAGDGGPRKGCQKPVSSALQWPLVWTGSGSRVEAYCEDHWYMLFDLLGVEGDNSNEEAFWLNVLTHEEVAR